MAKIIYNIIIVSLIIAVSGFIIIQINNRGEVSSNNTSIGTGNYTTPSILTNASETNNSASTEGISLTYSNFTVNANQNGTVYMESDGNGSVFFYSCSGSKAECDELFKSFNSTENRERNDRLLRYLKELKK